MTGTDAPPADRGRTAATADDKELLAGPQMSKRARIVAGVAFLFACSLLGYGCFLQADPPDLQITNNEGLEQFIPDRGAQVVRQTNVGAQLAEGYRGRLAVNGIAIPSTHLIGGANSPNFQVVTRVGQDGSDGSAPVLRTLEPESNCAEITFWPEDAPNDQTTVRWCFKAL